MATQSRSLEAKQLRRELEQHPAQVVAGAPAGRIRFQNIIRTQLVIGGLGTVLLFAGVTKAQEIFNTTFDDGPYVAPFDLPVAAPGADNSGSKSLIAQATPAMAAACRRRPDPRQQTTDEKEPSAIQIWMVGALMWIGAIVLYARGPAKLLVRGLRFLRGFFRRSRVIPFP
jgi:hypothetical protein